jgi:N-acetylglucosaminyl-diphospho-decaprenol L-rhamnosyltransferase
VTPSQPSSDHKLSIIIINWNTRDLLAQCLASLAASPAEAAAGKSGAGAAHASIETFVVDNASTDGSAQMVRERFPWVTLIENEANVGFARANNQALAQAAGAYLLLLNSDTAVHSGALPALVAFLEAHPAAGAVGPRLLNGDGSLQAACHPMLTPAREFWRLTFLNALWPRATYPMRRWSTQRPRRVEVIKGACLLLRRAALDQVGPLDEGYFMYTEEVDLCYRLAQAGWELWYLPQAVVTHYGEASSKQAAERMYVQLYRSKVQFYRKFGGERRARRFKRLTRLAYLPRLALAGLGGLARPAWRAQARTFRRLLAELGDM